MNKQEFLQEIKGQLIVSCQALPGEPLHGSEFMSKMAIAAKMGGAAAIRANSIADIKAIKQATQLPMIGLIKQNYPNCPVYITPTLKEVQALIHAGVDVIALDATKQQRPNHVTLKELIEYIRKHSHCLIMGDISTCEEGIYASECGVDLISTTLSSYTDYTKDRSIPDFPLLESLAGVVEIPVIAEGNIKTPGEAVKALELGAHAVVVGSAITRPQLITKDFADALKVSNKSLDKI
ncbi:N-acetylmannosamine-6-phosphate 2-epimerase [Lederbergia ruris]|uniref:N-acetylmannosamine-6-phosphate 2-epimerase n=1 Tax=Lederbergia ruris TaxID=217495 RepID=UPI0039A27B06